jgi:hypothetical protein
MVKPSIAFAVTRIITTWYARVVVTQSKSKVAQLKSGLSQWQRSLDSARLGTLPKYLESARSVKSWATLEEYLPAHALHVARTYWR